MQNYGTWKEKRSDLLGARLQTRRLGIGNVDLLGARGGRRLVWRGGQAGGPWGPWGAALTVTHAGEELRRWARLPAVLPHRAPGRNRHRTVSCLETFFRMIFQNDTPS